MQLLRRRRAVVSNLHKALEMKLIIKTLTLSTLLFSISCSNNQTEKEFSLTGNWINSFDEANKIIITQDGFFDRLLNDKSILDKFTILLEEDQDGNLIEQDYGKLKIQITNISNDSIYYSLIGSNNDKIFNKGIFLFRNDELLEITYKTLHGITDHIDEISLYHRQGNYSNQGDTTRIEKIIVPKGYIGQIYLSYDQQNGKEVQYDSSGNPLLFIQNNGTLKTKLKEDPFVIGKQKYEFYEIDSLTREISKITVFQHGDLRKINQQIKFRNKDIFLNADINQTGLFVYGFNQRGRESLENEIFKEKVYGNILCMEIDTIKERLHLDWYSENINN